MIPSEILQKEKILTLFEVIQIFLEEILSDDETINRDESILKIYFHNFDEMLETLHILKVLIFEIYFEIFDDKKQEPNKLKNNQNQNLQT
jgi:hypothetical protein